MSETTVKKAEKNPEVVEKATRRRFTKEYKRQIATEAEACREPGALGALLRREGLYSSTVSLWRRSTPGVNIVIIQKVFAKAVTFRGNSSAQA